MKPFLLLSNAVRAKEIITVLVRNGFLEFLRQVGVPHAWVTRIIPLRSEKITLWQRVRVTFEELGPTFVKFGQVISSRADVLPEGLIDELKKLRSQVRPVPWEQMSAVLTNELKGDVSEHFVDFDPTPVACGSLGQVYRARLIKDGREVAVKLQRPNIQGAIKSDLEIIGWFARQMHDRIPDLRPFDIPAVVEETGAGMLRELDFTIEARNAIYFNSINPYPERVFAPVVVEEYTTRRMLVVEWIGGKAPEKVDLPEEERRAIALSGGNSVFHQIVIAGFFHADPHTGNILITSDNRLCFIDWGLIGQLTRNMRYFLADLFSAISRQDAEKVVQVALTNALGKTRIDHTKLEKDVSFVLRKYPDFHAESAAAGRVLLDLLFVFGSNGIYLARDYALLAKAIVSIEEAAKTLDPQFDIRTVSGPFLRRLSVERWSPRSVARSTYWTARATLAHLRELPGTIQRILRTLEEGEIGIRIRHEGLYAMRETIDQSASRLTIGVIIGALLIGSSLIITTGVEPKLWGYPVLGILGFKFSAFLGIYIIWDIIRHGRHR